MFIDVTAAPYNADRSGKTDANAAFAKADGAGGTLYVPRGTYLVASNLTLSSDVRFEQGAVLQPGDGATVTLDGGLDAGPFQVFDVTTFPNAQVTPNRVEYLIPQWWGAVGDGVADDYPAIAAALAVARLLGGGYGSKAQGAVLFFPPGIYRVTRPLDCTGGQYNLRGSGRYQSVIRGDTGPGGAIIELVGSGYCTVEGFLLDTEGMANPSTVGVLMGRVPDPSTGKPAQSAGIHLVDLAMRLQSNPGANGGHGTVALYNYCSEVANYHGVFALADTAAVYTSDNLYDLDSYHRPRSQPGGLIEGDSSMTACTVTGHSSLWGLAGPALRLNGCANIRVHADISTLTPGSWPHAIEVLAQTTDFEYDGSMEEYPVLLFNSSFVSGMRLLGYAAYGTQPTSAAPRPAIVLLDTTKEPFIQDSTIDVVPTPGSWGGQLVDVTVDPEPGKSMLGKITGCHMVLHGANVRAGTVTGNLMTTSGNLSSVTINVGTNPAGVARGNLIVAADGVSVDGVVLGGERIDVGNAAAGSTLGTVVKKVEIFDAAGSSLGFIPVYNSIT